MWQNVWIWKGIWDKCWGSKGKWRPSMSLPVCSVAMTVEKWYNKYIIDLDSNRTPSETILRSHSDKWRKPALFFFLKPRLSGLACNGFWTGLQIKFCELPSCKRKMSRGTRREISRTVLWARSCKEKTQRWKLKRECSRRRTNVRTIQAIRAPLFYRDKKLKRAKRNSSAVKLYLNKKKKLEKSI